MAKKRPKKGGSGHRRVAQTQFLTIVGPRNRLKKKLVDYQKFLKSDSRFMISDPKNPQVTIFMEKLRF